MRALLLLVVCSLGGCTNRCKPGTVLLDLILDSDAASADQLTISVAIDGGAATTSPLPHKVGSTRGSVEVAFHGGYPTGRSVTFTVTAQVGNQLVASGSGSLTLGDRCSLLSLQLAGQHDGGIDDLASTDMTDGGTQGDLPALVPADLAPNCAVPTAPCQYPAGSISDFDVSGDSSVFSIYTSDNKNITGTCFSPDGSVKRANFAIFGSANSLQSLRVSTARTSGISLVTWAVQVPFDMGVDWSIMSRLYDANCMPIGAEFTWPSGTDADYVSDAAIDGAGNSYLLWKNSGATNLYLSLFDPTGAKVGADLLVDGTGACGGNGYGIHVAVNATDGSGIVTCQQHLSSPVRFRRFGANHAFLDPQMIDVAESAAGHSSWYESHQVGMTDDGSFVIEWEDGTSRQFRANFYAPDKTLTKSVTLAPTGNQYYDGFRYNHPSVELVGESFILRNGPGKQFWQYSTTGELLGCDQPSMTTVLRTGGTGTTFTLAGGALYRGELYFGRFNYCAPATCGNGTLDANEECDDKNLEPYDGCNQFCKSEYCGDGVVTDQEECDDGGASILCTASCQLNPQTPPVGGTIMGVDDFDVSADGTLITVQQDTQSGVLYATCYQPDRTLLRQRFPLTATEWLSGSPLVMMSRVSKKSLVSWTDQTTVGAKLLDADCFMAHAHVTALSAYNGYFDAAIDDTGRSVVASAKSADTTLRVAFFDATGTPVGSEQMLPSGAGAYGIHVAMNQMSGGGVLSFQQSGTGDVVYFNRFNSDGTWAAVNFVKAGVGVPGVAYYDGHTVGMNDAGQHVLIWRNATNGNMTAAFFDATGALAGAPVVYSTTVRSNEGTSFYDSFRRKHQKIALKGANFVLGETYNSIVNSSTNPGDKTQVYFVCTPAGVCTIQYSNTLRFVDSGTNDRLDGNVISYFLQGSTIYYGAGQL